MYTYFKVGDTDNSMSLNTYDVMFFFKSYLYMYISEYLVQLMKSLLYGDTHY